MFSFAKLKEFHAGRSETHISIKRTLCHSLNSLHSSDTQRDSFNIMWHILYQNLASQISTTNLVAFWGVKVVV